MINSVSMGQMSQMMTPKMPPMRNPGEQSAESLINKADANGDGVVDKSELTSFIQTASANNDDSTTTAMADEMFADFDADGDGNITQDEASTAIDALASSMRQELQGGMPPPPPPGGHEPPDVESIFSTADADSSDSLDESEFVQMLQNGPMGSSADSEAISAMFTEADSDGDGLITQDELQTAMESHHERGGGQESTDKQPETGNDRINPIIAQLLRYYQQDSETIASEVSETA